MSPNGDRHPLLFLPRPSVAQRGRLTGGGGRVGRPPIERQQARLTPKFAALQTAFEQRRAELQATISGAEPESVLVLEVADSIEAFINAVQRIEGLEFLGEFDEEDIPPDEDFRFEDDPDKPYTGILFLVMTNQQALQQLLGLWNSYKSDPQAKFQRGLTRFRYLFEQLRDVRLWDVRDRIDDTGIREDWTERVAQGEDDIPAEIELWFRRDAARREASESSIRELVEAEVGTVLGSAVIEEIAYHAMVVRLPAQAVGRVLQQADAVQLVRAEGIMFIKPTGQAVTRAPEEEPVQGVSEVEPLESGRPPVAALLDGLPVEQHVRLSGRLVVDDPDDWGQNYQAIERNHGTEMSSVIVWGDIGGTAEAAISSRLYVRPIMRPDPRDWRTPRGESIPSDVLTVDLVHSAVVRMLDEGQGTASSPTVRVINLSVADRYSPFTRMMSPWARLLDWLSWRYGVLFIVAAGNYERRPIQISLPLEEVNALSIEDKARQTLRAIATDGANRRLLAPAESCNALTIGSAHSDAAGPFAPGPRHDLLGDGPLPSPFSAIGLGYRRSVKPDLILPGGRLLFAPSHESPDGVSIFEAVVEGNQPPGVRAARPSRQPGVVNAEGFSVGTSYASALATRAAIQILETLETLESEPGFALGDNRLRTLMTKALLVHSSAWGGSGILRTVFQGMVSPRKLQEFTSRFVGFGIADPERVYGSTDQRVTLLGAGEIAAEEGHLFEFPLPPSLSGQNTWRRLTVTLAWMSPMNPRNRKYRRAALWFDSPNALETTRTDVEWRSARRGTVQHEVFEGSQAVAYVDGERATIRVNCKPDAGPLLDKVPYALAVSLEVAAEIELPIYDEVRERIRPLVQVKA